MRLAASAKRGNKSMRDVRGIFPSEGKVVKGPTEITESLRPDSGRGKILSEHTTSSKTDKESSFALDIRFQGRASKIRLNGVCVARRKCEKPPQVTTSPSRFSPA